LGGKRGRRGNSEEVQCEEERTAFHVDLHHHYQGKEKEGYSKIS
jgi:hypothetical protein